MESLCRLLNTVGKALDEGKAKTRMNAIYEALEHVRQTSDLDSRIKFKILDVLDLRKNGWVGRTTGQTGPKTIQEIHDDVNLFSQRFDSNHVGCKTESGPGIGETKYASNATRVWSWRCSS